MITSPAVIAFATDTVYGLGARFDDTAALSALYHLKNRSDDQPMQILVADRAMAATLVDLPDAQPLDAHTRIYPLRPGVQIDGRIVADGGVGVRMPDLAALRDYIQNIGVPLVASSANLHGLQPLRTVKAVREAFPAIPVVIAEDRLDGHPSQLWDIRAQPPKRLR